MAKDTERGKTHFMAAVPMAHGRTRNRTKIYDPSGRKSCFLLVEKPKKTLNSLGFSHVLWYNYLIKNDEELTNYECKRCLYRAP